jgi:hypothetical protein
LIWTGIVFLTSQLCTVCKSENSVPCQPSGLRVIPSGHPAVQCLNRPDAHKTKASSVRTTWIPVRTFLYVAKLRTGLAYICPNVSAARLDNSQCLTKASYFLSKIEYRKIAATVRTTWIPVRMSYSLRQVSNSNSTVRTPSYHGPDM